MRGRPQHRPRGSSHKRARVRAPGQPTTAGTPSIGSTLTITAPSSGGPVSGYHLFRDGILVGSVTSGYVYTASDIGPAITVRAWGPGGEGAASAPLTAPAPLASWTSIRAHRDTSGMVVSGGGLASWADTGGPFQLSPWVSVGTSPVASRRLGKWAAAFDTTSNPYMTPQGSPTHNTLGDLIGTGAAFRIMCVVSPGAVTRGGGDPYDDECIIQDTSLTRFTLGFSKSAGKIYVRAAMYHAGTQYTTASQASVEVVQGSWYVVDLSFDGTTLSLSVNGGTAATASPGGGPDVTTGTLAIGRNWRNTQYSNFSIAYFIAANATQSATVAADSRAWLAWAYQSRTPYNPALADWWCNGETGTRNSLPKRSSQAFLVGDVTASQIWVDVSIFSTPVDATNDTEFSLMIGTGQAGAVAWSSVIARPEGVHTDGSGWQLATLGPFPIPGTGTRRVWVVGPARGTGIEYTIQGIQLDAGAWTPASQPSSGALLALDAEGGASLGNSNLFGFYYVRGSLVAGYAATRTACMARLTQATAGQTAGTVVLFSPQTNDFRNYVISGDNGTNTTPTDAYLQAQLVVSTIKSTLPGWLVVYYPLAPLADSWAGQDAWAAQEIAGALAGGADRVGTRFVWSTAQVGDGTHPYLEGAKSAAAQIVSDVQALGRGGRMIALWCGNSLSCGSAWRAPTDRHPVYAPAEGLPALLRGSGW